MIYTMPAVFYVYVLIKNRIQMSCCCFVVAVWFHHKYTNAKNILIIHDRHLQERLKLFAYKLYSQYSK